LHVLRYLVQNGADVNLPAKNGITLLGVAIHKNQTEVAKFLLKYDANIEITKLLLKIHGEVELIKILDKLCIEIEE